MAGVQVLHATAGRLRIKAAVLNDAAHTAILLERLRALRGVSRVEINPVTRNTVILYEPHQVTQTTLYGHLESLFGGPVRIARSGSVVTSGSDIRAHLAGVLLKSAMEAALHRAVLALI